MHALRKIVQSPVVVSIVLSGIVFLSIIGLRSLGVLTSPELTTYDLLLRTRLAVTIPDPAMMEPDPRIVLITISDQNIKHFIQQNQWPIPDYILTQALQTLAANQPRAIGLDLYRDLPHPPGSEAFEAALQDNPRLIAITKFDPKESILPPAVLRGTERVGFNDFIVDPGGIVRRGLLFLDDGTSVSYSLALRLALLYLQDEGVVPQPDPVHPKHLRLGPTTIRPFASNDGGYVRADDRGYQFLLDFYGAPQEFASYSLLDLLAEKVPPEAISGKVALIGVAVSESVKDYFFTPFSDGGGKTNEGAESSGVQRMAGITLHAHSISQLLRAALSGKAMIHTTSDTNEALWILLWSVLGGALGFWTRSLWRFSFAVSGGLIILGGSVYAAFLNGWWIPIIAPALAWLIATALVTAYKSNQEKEQRALLMQLFSRHVSPDVAETVWQQREQFLEGGRLRPQGLVATVLFTDLVGFTSVSEKLTPQALMEWLNEYMEAMAQDVIRHGGVINKYIGDSIMAIFGVPIARTTEEEIGHDAIQAVHCALSMAEILQGLNHRWKEQGLPTIGMRVGIFTGPLVAGSLGSSQRLEYTVIGDTVNTASRLESFDKNVLTPDTMTRHSRVLVGEVTAGYLGQRFQIERVGEVNLKGKDDKVTIYHVLCPADGDLQDLKEGVV